MYFFFRSVVWLWNFFKNVLRRLGHIVAKLEVKSVKTQKVFFVGISEGKSSKPKKNCLWFFHLRRWVFIFLLKNCRFFSWKKTVFFSMFFFNGFFSMTFFAQFFSKLILLINIQQDMISSFSSHSSILHRYKLLEDRNFDDHEMNAEGRFEIDFAWRLTHFDTIFTPLSWPQMSVKVRGEGKLIYTTTLYQRFLFTGHFQRAPVLIDFFTTKKKTWILFKILKGMTLSDFSFEEKCLGTSLYTGDSSVWAKIPLGIFH